MTSHVAGHTESSWLFSVQSSDTDACYLTGVAGLSLPVVDTVAVEVVQQVDALASVLTRVSVALVHIWKKIQQ